MSEWRTSGRPADEIPLGEDIIRQCVVLLVQGGTSSEVHHGRAVLATIAWWDKDETSDGNHTTERERERQQFRYLLNSGTVCTVVRLIHRR